jgi:hypothetical protein
MDEDGNLVDLDGFPDSIRFLVEYIQKNGPFDGVLGFSQGAGLAVLLLLILSQDDWRGRFNIPSHVPQFRLAIILSGFRFQTPNFADYYTRGMLDIPTMHVYSDQDTIISVDRSLDLIDNTFTDAVQCRVSGMYLVLFPPMSLALTDVWFRHRIVATPGLIKAYERFFHRFVYIQPTTSL